MAKLDTLTVHGSYGQFIVVRATGAIMSAHLWATDYHGVTRFDVAEWENYLRGIGLNPDERESADIVDVGYWDGDEFVAPEQEHREISYEGREP